MPPPIPKAQYSLESISAKHVGMTMTMEEIFAEINKSGTGQG
jgi:hypothetical protein